MTTTRAVNAALASAAFTHLGRYVDAAGHADPGIKLMLRLKVQLDAALG